jgi:F0F1-type ATP synthase assembly protein I
VDVSQRREATQEMHRNSGGFELVLSPLLLGLIGFGLDRWLGTLPVITVIFTVLGLVGVCLKLYYGYKFEMDQHEANAPWARNDD